MYKYTKELHKRFKYLDEIYNFYKSENGKTSNEHLTHTYRSDSSAA